MGGYKTPIWGVHLGKTGGADSLIFHKNWFRLAGTRIGGLSQLPADRGDGVGETDVEQDGYPV